MYYYGINVAKYTHEATVAAVKTVSRKRCNRPIPRKTKR